MPVTVPDLESLYRLPLAEFTAARNQLARALRSAGDRSAADEVKALRKPSVSAWAVNQLYATERESFEALLGAAREQRLAVTRGGSISSETAERRRQAMNDLLRAAGRLLEQSGSIWSPALRQRVARTLEALAAQGPEAETSLGRLTEDLQPAGFDALLGTAVAPPARKIAARAKSRSGGATAAARRRLAAARAEVEGTRKELATARRKRTASGKNLARLETRAGRARERAKAAERKAETARREADALDLELRMAKTTLDEAARAAARLQARLAAETHRLEELG